jgi:hypothetical protein
LHKGITIPQDQPANFKGCSIEAASDKGISERREAMAAAEKLLERSEIEERPAAEPQ